MSYTTPVTDRTAADLVARNSKAFMNVADWVRIYENSRIVHDIVEIEGGSPIAFTAISTPTSTSIPMITDVNTLTENIETTRFELEFIETVPGAQIPIKHDYEAGASKPAFDYKDVNRWESTLDAIFEFFGVEECPTLSANLTVLTGTHEIYVDCLDMATFDVDLQSTANLYII